MFVSARDAFLDLRWHQLQLDLVLDHLLQRVRVKLNLLVDVQPRKHIGFLLDAEGLFQFQVVNLDAFEQALILGFVEELLELFFLFSFFERLLVQHFARLQFIKCFCITAAAVFDAATSNCNLMSLVGID